MSSIKVIPDIKFINKLKSLAEDGYVYEFEPNRKDNLISISIYTKTTDQPDENSWTRKIEPDDEIFIKLRSMVIKNILCVYCNPERNMMNFQIDMIGVFELDKYIEKVSPKMEQ